MHEAGNRQQKTNPGSLVQQGSKGISLQQPAQFKEEEKFSEEEPLTSLAGKESSYFQPPVQKKDAAPKNETGMPDNLKSGLESLSGFDLSDVRVHYNSSQPAQLNALAYAQGGDIHVAPGQEKHVPHEGWHVVQQRQGRVQPTTSVNNVAVNDNAGLETEADMMGSKALQLKTAEPFAAAWKMSGGGTGKNVTQQMPVTQFVITGEVTVAVNSCTQTTKNHCWAAAGWCIHSFYGGAHASESDFVKAQASPSGKGTYTKDFLTDINQAIGDKSKENLLSGSDDTGSYSKATISSELGKDQPIVANVGGVHYVVICGKRKNDDMYQLRVMDPLNGGFSWQDTAGADAYTINSVGGVNISVLYYTKA